MSAKYRRAFTTTVTNCCRKKPHRTSYCSVLTILAFSFERYLAICHPLYSYTMAGLKRTARIIVALWICSALAAAPFFHYTKIHYWRFSDPFHGNIVEQSAFC